MDFSKEECFKMDTFIAERKINFSRYQLFWDKMDWKLKYIVREKDFPKN